MHGVRLRRTVTWVAIALATIVTLAIPLIHAADNYAEQSEKIELKASFLARDIARHAYLNEGYWQYQLVRLNAIIELPPQLREINRVRLFDGTGRALLVIGPEVAWPVLSRSAPITVRGAVVGRIDVEKSLLPVLFGTALIAIFSILVGLATYIAVRTLPLRALDRALAAVETQNMRFDGALNSMSQGLCMLDANQKVLVANNQYCDIFGLARDQVQVGTSLQEIYDRRRANGSYSGPMPDRKKREMQEVQVLNDGRSVLILRHDMPGGGSLATVEDITERAAAAAKIAHLAKHDPLTGFANRAALMEQVEEALVRLRRDGETFSFMLLDLDRFKAVNDTLGHHAGDVLLQETARRIKSSVPDSNTVVLSRLGGDEFAIVLKAVSDAQRSKIADDIVRALAEPFDVMGSRVNIGTSIGIVMAPTHGVDAIDLIKKADIALYRAKGTGRNRSCLFHSSMLDEIDKRSRLETDLRGAIARKELTVHYQPIVDAKTGATCCVEALARWHHPELGIISPKEFIGIAEQTGQVIALGELILRQACTAALGWPEHIKLSVNLSPAQFKVANLPETIMGALGTTGLPPQRLEVEIAEAVMLANEPANLAALHQLKGLGISVALDDFGTGYSSLGCLSMFPFDKIEIDKQFIRSVSSRAGHAAMISSVLAIGRDLGITTIAEGVETRQQFEILRASGIAMVQGDYFSKPVPAADLDFGDLVAERRRVG
jgi:diguanylate cyclase (GGDEF)-like protein